MAHEDQRTDGIQRRGALGDTRQASTATEGDLVPGRPSVTALRATPPVVLPDGSIPLPPTPASSVIDIINRSNVVVFVWRIAENWPVEFVSDNVSQWGYDTDDLFSGRVTWASMVHPDDVPWLETEVAGYIRGGVRNFTQVYRIITRSGETRWVEDNTVACYTPSGDLTHFEGVIRDITQRVRGLEELRASEARFRTLFEQANDGYLLAEILPDGRLGCHIEANDAACRMLGYSLEELRRLTPHDLTDDPRAYAPAAIHELHVGTQHRRPFESTMRAKSGRVIPVEIQAQAFRLNNTDTALGIIRDLSERKQMEANARQLQQMAETEQLRRRFLSYISHELKTPLTPIRSALEVLLSGTVGPATPQQSELLHLMAQQSGRLERLIKDLLRLYQLEHGGMTLTLAPVDLCEVTRASLRAFRDRYAAKGLYLREECPGEMLPISADAERLGEVIDNLLENALKFTEQGGVIVRLAPLDGARVSLRVIDTGVGIAAPDIPQVFEAFYQVQRNHRGGLGLGLPIVKHLVSRHGGEVIVTSPGLGQGATVTVILPVTPPADGTPVPPVP